MWEAASAHTLLAMMRLANNEKEEPGGVLEYLCAQQPEIIAKYKYSLNHEKSEKK